MRARRRDIEGLDQFFGKAINGWEIKQLMVREGGTIKKFQDSVAGQIKF